MHVQKIPTLCSVALFAYGLAACDDPSSEPDADASGDTDIVADGDQARDSDHNGDGDADTDADIDGDADADGDADVDGDADSDADSDQAMDAEAGSCDGVTCSGHGQCVERAGGPECDCDPCYFAVGLRCEEQMPEPEAVPLAPLLGENPAGASTSVTVREGRDTFHDEYLYDATGAIMIGVRREWGGTVTFFGMADQPRTNTIDANDTGREVQVAFYDPDRQMQNCAWNQSCARQSTECPFSITYLGWNPVQGGNRCNRGSGVESLENGDGVLSLMTNPLFWNPNWDERTCNSSGCDSVELRERRSDVNVRQTMRFVRTHIVELTYEVENLSGDNHRATNQEMPTVYTANGRNRTPDLWRLFTSEGAEIDIDVPANDGFFTKRFDSPGGWVTMQNTELNYGVGMYYENRLVPFQGWQNRDLPFNNFRAEFSFGIPPHGVVYARAYLILGSMDAIAAEAAWLDENLPPFGVIDIPAADEAVSGQTTVAGWALDNHGVTGLTIWVDGEQVGTAHYGNARGDVCLVWPQYPGCPNVGYTATIDVSGLDPCAHLLEVRAQDAHGADRVIARRRFVVTP